MHYQEYPVIELLQPYIKVIWSMESEGSYAPPMRILPDSCVELVIHYNQPYKTTFGNSEVATQPQSFVAAQMKNFIEIEPNGKIGFVAIRFSAHGAYQFFGLPMTEIVNGITDLKFIWNSLAKEIEETIIESKTNVQRISRMQNYLIAQLLKRGQPDLTVNYCLDLIYSAKGQLRIEDLSIRAGISNRQLLRRFNNCIGMPPKEFSKIIQFIGSLHYLRKNRDSSLAEAAQYCGYFDQAHFIHDFKNRTGLTPAQFQLQENVFF